jgi:hypothetical protein
MHVPRISLVVGSTRGTHHARKYASLIRFVLPVRIAVRLGLFAHVIGNRIQYDFFQHTRLGFVVRMRIAHTHGRHGLSNGGQVRVTIDAHHWFRRLSVQFQNGKVANKLIGTHVHKIWMSDHLLNPKLLVIAFFPSHIVLETVRADPRLHIAASTRFTVTGCEDDIGSNQGTTAVMIQGTKVGITALGGRVAVNNEVSVTLTVVTTIMLQRNKRYDFE